MKFFSLENYTTYSVLSGMMNPSQWVDRASELGYTALGICDKGTMGGHMDFQEQCQKKGIKPIFGASYIIVDDALERAKGNEGSLLLYAKDAKGYENLIRINNFANDSSRGSYYHHRADVKVITEHSEGLIVVVPANYAAYADKPQKLGEMLQELEKAFGEDLYVGVNPVDPTEAKALSGIQASKTWKTVPVYHCHYPHEAQGSLYEVVRNIEKSKTKKQNFHRSVVDGFLPESGPSETLSEIFDKCDYLIPTGKFFMPVVQLGFGDTIEEECAYHLCVGICAKLWPEMDPEEMFQTVLKNGKGTEAVTSLIETLRKLPEFVSAKPSKRATKYPHTVSVLESLGLYLDRLETEVKVIQPKGFYDYFEIVRDLVSFIDKQGKDRGAARGSAAGSLFSYLLNITKVDPIEHGLLFERFLNEDRNDLPDIDMDFAQEDREDIKEYLFDKYGGETRVCSIGSYERYKTAGLLQDLLGAYAWGAPDEHGDIIAYDSKYITMLMNYHVPGTVRGLEELALRLEYEPFAEFYAKHKTWFEEVVEPLFDTINNVSIHPAGSLVTAFPIDECMPVIRRSDGTTLTQWRDKYCELRGFPKLDILGIKAVDIISYTKRLVMERHGVEIPDIEDIPLDDDAAFGVFQKAQTDGVFQFKSYGQHSFLPVFDPRNFYDLVVATSVKRPGPEDVGADEDILKIRHGLKEAEFDCVEMEEITKDTFGFVLYQEQLMQTVRVIGGLTGSEADYVRKACGKKKLSEMQKWEQVFKDGGLERGHSEELLDKLWTKIVAFAEYGFNKSHSVSYCLTSYLHAWLKSRYPTEFWCAALKYASTDAKKYDSIFNLKGRATSEGFEFVFPTLHAFSDDFYPEGQKGILWPLQSIKGIGPSATQGVTCNGTKRSYKDVEEMVEMTWENANLGVFKKLIQCGYFLPIADTPWDAAKKVFEVRNEIAGKKDKLPYELSHENLADWQDTRNKVFGFTVSSWKDSAPFHPNVMRISTKRFKTVPDDTRLLIGGMVEDLRIRHYRKDKNKFYAQVTLTDDGEEYKIFIWDKMWMSKHLDIQDMRPRKGDLIELACEKSSWNDRPQASVNEANSYIRIVRRAKK